MHARTRRWACLLPLALSACASFRPVALTPGATPTIDPRHPVRATLASGARMVLYNPGILADSLVGNVGAPPVRTAVALRDIQGLETLRTSPTRTAAAVAGTVAAGYLVLLSAVLVSLIAIGM